MQNPYKCLNIIKRVVKHTIPYIRLRALTGIAGGRCSNKSSLAKYLGVSLSTTREIVEDLDKMGILNVKLSGWKKGSVLGLNKEYKDIFRLKHNL